MPNCGFCDMTLQSQLDVSKHLASQTHRDNVKKYRDIHPQNKSSLKDTPSNIIKVFESLKIRHPSEVRNLADKTYFKIRSQDKEKSAAFLGVADELVNVLLECIVDYRTRFCNPENKRKIKDSFCRVKEEPKEQGHKNRDKDQTTRTQSVNPNPAAQQPQSSNRPVRDTNTPSRSPPLKRRPPPVNPVPVRPTQPVGTQVSTPHSSRAATNVGVAPRQRSQNDARGPVGVNNPRPNLANPPRPRTAGLIPNSRPVASRGSTDVTAQSRPSHRQTAPAPRGPEVQTTRPISQQVRNQRPSVPQVTQAPRPPLQATRPPRPPVPQAPRQSRPSGPQTTRTPRPPSDIPPPEQMPMAGASFMPYNPMRNEPPPQPRLDSSYRPRLAKIKVEPKDK